MRAIFQLVGRSGLPVFGFLWRSFGIKLGKFIGLLGIYQTMNDINLIV